MEKEWAKGPPTSQPKAPPWEKVIINDQALKGRHRTTRIPCPALSGLAHSIDLRPRAALVPRLPWAGLRQAVGLNVRRNAGQFMIELTPT